MNFTRAPQTRAVSLWLSLLLAVLALGTFWPAVHNGFVVLDDPEFVTGNPHVTTGLTWENIKWAFTSLDLSNWHPLTWLSYMADCHFFGLNAAHHHFTNIAFHAANAVLVFLVLRGLTGATWRSFFVAMLFAVHPLRVESVAWLAERKDVLSTFFWMLALWAYAIHANRASHLPASGESSRNTQHATRNTRHVSLFYALSLFFFTCGLMSKPMLVTVPFVLLLLDVWPLRRVSGFGFSVSNSERPEAGAGDARFGRQKLWFLILEKIPFLALAIVAGVLTVIAQRTAGAFAGAGALPVSARVENAVISCARYLGKIFWPHPLAIGYPYPDHWPALMVCSSLLLLLCVTAVAAAQCRQRPYLIVGWLWFLVTLAPVIGIIQAGPQAMADRYTYVPAIGVFLMIAWGATDLFANFRARNLLLAWAAGAVIAGCIVTTCRQIPVWKNSQTLLEHAVAVVPGNYFAHYWLGVSLADAGHLDAGVREIQMAVRLHPSADIQKGFGEFLEKHGDPTDAIREFQASLALDAANAETHLELGHELFLQDRIDEATAEYQEAQKLGESKFAVYSDLAGVLSRKGQYQAAVGAYYTALHEQPHSADAHYNLGNALVREGRVDEAIAEFRESLRLKPDAPDVRNNLGVTLTRRGRVDEAIEQFQEALKLKPGDADAQRNLAAAKAFQQRKGR